VLLVKVDKGIYHIPSKEKEGEKVPPKIRG